jgi:hypothetical protein
MQILINGEERLYSKKERYMKSELFSELNSKGFQIGLSCTKRIDLFIKQIKITENEDDFNIIHPQREEIPPITYNKEPAFDTYISELSDIFKNEIININNYLFSLKSLKFKRKVADSKITYLSPASGFAYVIFVSEKLFKQYIYRYNDKTDDRMTDVLRIINLQSPELANKLFGQLNECFGGGCVSTRTYNWNGITKKACGGRIEFKMDIIDFNNVKEFFKCAEELSQN